MTGRSARFAFGVDTGGHATQLALAVFVVAALAPRVYAGTWPESSSASVLPLEHASLQQRVQALGSRLEDTFQFIVFGDQRALADGEWQAMMRHVAVWDQDESGRPPLLFTLDTGDIVEDGRHSDQFAMLQEILSPIRAIPYFVTPGNHELRDEEDPLARENLERFLGLEQIPGIDTPLHQELRFMSLRLLIIDSNLLAYRRPNELAGRWRKRADSELRWLKDRLDEKDDTLTTIVALHHPLLQSSKKHRKTARELWSTRLDGVQFADLLIDGGVDVVLCGHTHSYELFRVTREDDRFFWQVNLSGRPRNSFLWFGSGPRRAEDMRGGESEWLADKGFADLDGWRIEQADAMTDYELDQFAVFTVHGRGRLDMQIVYVGRDESDPIAPQPVRTLLPGAR
jgi:hypothetical protein